MVKTRPIKSAHSNTYDVVKSLTTDGREKLIPPLVDKVRSGVKAWRDSGYTVGSETTRSLLEYWFEEEHLIPQADGTMVPFRWYFAQREAVESAIWRGSQNNFGRLSTLPRGVSSRSVR